MQQNATLFSPEQDYAKDVALYERLFPAFSEIVMTLICCFTVGKTKASVIVAETENIFISSFFIIYLVRRSLPSVFMLLFLSHDIHPRLIRVNGRGVPIA